MVEASKAGTTEVLLSNPGITVRTVFDARSIRCPIDSPPNNTGLPIPTRIRRAGELFRITKARDDFGAGKFASYYWGIQGEDVEAFEQGTRVLNLRRVVHHASRFTHEETAEMIEFKKIALEEQWMQTLTHGTFRKEGLTLGRAITLLRLSNLQTKKEFFNEAQVGEGQLTRIEHDRVTPLPHTINRLIETAGLNALGLPAQQIRLLREKRLPMTLTQLQACTFPQLFQYLRQLQGYSRYDVQNQIGKRKSRGHLAMIENGQIKPTKETKDTLIAFLKLDPRSALAEIIHDKAEDPPKPITDDMVQRVLYGEHDGQYLFAGSLQQTGAVKIEPAIGLLNNLEEERQRLLQSGQSKNVVGILLDHLKKSKSLSLRELARRSGMYLRETAIVLRGEAAPEDTTMMKLLVGLGYDIHHPVTWYFLDIADAKKRSRT